MDKEELEKLDIERKKKLYLASDIREVVDVIDKLNNSSRQEIIDILEKKASDLTEEAGELLSKMFEKN